LLGRKWAAGFIGTGRVVDDVPHFREACRLETVLFAEGFKLRLDDEAGGTVGGEQRFDVGDGFVGRAHGCSSFWLFLEGASQRRARQARRWDEIGSARAAASRGAS